jgi:predicted MFS family arabinose efflux permease
LNDSSPNVESIHPESAPLSIGAERRLLALLASIQFINLVDFIIMMPLGPRLMKALEIGTPAHGKAISAYGYAAGLAGFFAAVFINRFPRKTALLSILTGFAAGTALCAVASDFWTLVAGRSLAGAFGGVLGGMVLTIIGDAVPPERRGAATGIVMMGFSVASVLGLPIGLSIAEQFDRWQAPFAVLTALIGVVLIASIAWMPSISAPRARRNSDDLWDTLRDPVHLRAYSLMAGLMIAGFCIVPYIANYVVLHVGLTQKRDVPLMYFLGGLCTLASVPLIGRLSDRFGKLYVFRIAAAASIIPIACLTLMPTANVPDDPEAALTPNVPVSLVLATTTLFMICMSGRAVPAIALIVGSAAPRLRASFMSVNGSVQHISMGLAADLGSWISRKDMSGYGWDGLFAALMTIVCMVLAGTLPVAGREMKEETPSKTIEREEVLAEAV